MNRAARHQSPTLLQRPLTRAQAVVRATRLIRRQGWRQAEVLRLISLFCLQPEELLEAGLNYETVRSMESLCWPDSGAVSSIRA